MYAIKILDDKQKLIGEMMIASCSDIVKFINKGFTVINIETNREITLESMNETLGVSDGTIMMG